MNNLILNDPTGASGYGAQLSKNLTGLSSTEVKEQIEIERLAAASAELEANKGWKSAENKKFRQQDIQLYLQNINVILIENISQGQD